MDKDDLKKQSKVIDMMSTMHSILANRYRFLSKILEIMIAAASIVLVAFTFADSQVISFFGLSPENGRIFIGVSSILVFFLSIVSLIVDWKGKATLHKEAFDTLIRQKAEWRDLLTQYDNYNEQYKAEFTRRSALIVGNLIPIPDSSFNRLKSRHYKKVVLSTMISSHPDSSLIVLRSHLWLRGLRQAWKAKFPDEN